MSLNEYRILNTSEEGSFDEIVLIAATLLESPIAMIGFLDGDRVWFKARIGVSVREVPADAALCSLTVKHSKALIVADTHQDPMLKSHPMVTEEPKIRFYAGAPLRTPNGEIIGSLCVADVKPKVLSTHQARAFTALANRVVAEMALRKAMHDAADEEQRKQDQRAKLTVSAKLAALGEMAGGIAHEINNPLAIISGKATLLKSAFEQGKVDSKKVIQELDKIDSTCHRIAKIIKGLRQFSRNAERDPMMPVEVKKILEDTLELCQEKIKNRGVDLRVNVPDGVKINCRPSQISQIMMNLLSNSLDAIENLPERWISVEAKINSRGLIQIDFVDCGKGIDPEVVAKMMYPFFSTKEVGKGTGLGLSISKGIAEDHGGSLKYDPNAAHTTFVLEIKSAA